MSQTFFSNRTKLLRFDRGRKGIQEFLAAWQAAESIEFPRRQKLMDVYDMVMLDNHLSGIIENLEFKILGETFLLLDEKDKPSEQVKLLQKRWFGEFIHHVLSAKYYGYSLIELKEFDKDGQVEKIALVERRNIIPEKKEVLINTFDTKGERFDNPAYSDFYIFIENGLGMLLKASPMVIYKRFSMGSHASFNERFGLPTIIVKTDKDAIEKEEIEKQMLKVGVEGLGILDKDDEVDYLQPQSGADSSKTFENLTERVNSELSKLVLGHTKNADDEAKGGSQQTYINKDAINKTPSEERVEAYMEDLQTIVNELLIPRLIRFGYPFKGLRFVYNRLRNQKTEENRKSISPELLKVILEHYEIPEEFFNENFGLKVIKKNDSNPLPTTKPIDVSNIKNKYDFGCVMLNVSEASIAIWTFLTQHIKAEDLYINLEENIAGIEKEPHVTLLYGLHADINDNDVLSIMREIPKIDVNLLDISFFEAEDYDVLKFSVRNPLLNELNLRFKELPHTSPRLHYSPHATIAYLQKGTAQKYVIEYGFLMKEFLKLSLDMAVYSKSDGNKIAIPLLDKTLENKISNLYNYQNTLDDEIKKLFKRFTKAYENIATKIFSKGSLLFDNTIAKLTSKYLEQSISTLTDYEKINALKENVYWFSGVKTYQQLSELSSKLVDESGRARSFESFMKEAKKVNERYNLNYLKAEYEHAMASAQMISIWNQYVGKNPNVLLKYSAVGDDRTTPLCQQRDGIILPASDSFWIINYPPNHWGPCRSTVIPMNEDTPLVLPKNNLQQPEGIFASNVALDGIVFPKQHPYFENISNEGLARIKKFVNESI